MGSHVDAESPQQQEMSRRIRDRKAAVDVSIIITAFLVCFLPTWIMGFFRNFVPGVDVPAEAVLATSCIFFLTAIWNPIIYSICRREFRVALKKVFRRVGVCQDPNDNSVWMKSKMKWHRKQHTGSRPVHQHPRRDACMWNTRTGWILRNGTVCSKLNI